jgi:hypothetical protein
MNRKKSMPIFAVAVVAFVAFVGIIDGIIRADYISVAVCAVVFASVIVPVALNPKFRELTK